MERHAKHAADSTGECRQCCTFCDKLVQPRGCMEIGCRYLYTYSEERSGRRYVGCMNKVFKVEIDLDLFEEMERGRAGFGGVKMTGQPLPQCQFAVEPSYEGAGPAFDCVNPRFYDCTDAGPEGLRVLDIRDLAA